jgi:circadian clock protein KaiC
MFVAFREPAAVLEARGEALGIALSEKARGTGSVRLLRRSSVGAHIDEVLNEVLAIADEERVERLVIDGLPDLLQVIPEDRRAHEVFARLAELLWARGITSLLVLGTPGEVGPELDFTNSLAAAMAENVLLLRYVERGQELGRVVSVLKMAASSHDTRARQYVLTAKGLQVLARTESPEGFLQGVDGLSSERRGKPAPLPSASLDDEQ